ncbi:MAG TPA: ribosome maturation factor RimM [Kofleriaceae bacterium]|jgi:16S rRNA processing protein RimM|nr:ribosome maturation factor RimM [Kofleriaceae bacterium]
MDTGRRILIARVAGAFGVRGEVKLQSFTDPDIAALRYQPWTLVHRGSERPVSGARGRQTAKGVVATLPGVADRDAAEALAGAEVWVERAQLPPPAPGEYYWVDLEGLEVVNLEGVVLGRVSHLLNTGANDILSVAGDRERLIPFLEPDFVKSVDFEARRITVDWDADF